MKFKSMSPLALPAVFAFCGGILVCPSLGTTAEIHDGSLSACTETYSRCLNYCDAAYGLGFSSYNPLNYYNRYRCHYACYTIYESCVAQTWSGSK